jgi:hypothetical protein
VREHVSGVVRAREGGRARLREVESVVSWKAVFENDARAREWRREKGTSNHRGIRNTNNEYVS